jgi:FkbM family methyltransferase
LYCGLKDFEDMGFLLHFLRSEDCFVDVGANIGSYTILASAHVGAETIAFEPSPRTFKNLMDNIYINNCNRKVSAYQTSLGACDGSIGMTFAIDAMNNHIAQTEDLSSISVKMVSLDEMLLNHNVPTLIKIDVEGYETEVLKGAQQTLKDRGLNAIIIELMGLGKRYGFNEHDIHEMLISHGFFPYNYDPLQRELITIDSFGPRNTIYIRDLEFVYKRLKSAEKITILGIEF